MTGLRTILTLLIGGLLFALLAGLSFCGRGIAVKAPSRLETRLMTVAKHRLLVNGREAKNPLPNTTETVTAGRQGFLHYCYACHGLDGQATGVPFADAMSPPVPSLASSNVQTYSDGQLHWVIENGLWPTGMPAAKGILTDDEIWSVVTYIRHLPPAGSMGEPPAYSGEDCPPTCD
jgi:mono/diheme cytochrome c family protein